MPWRLWLTPSVAYLPGPDRYVVVLLFLMCAAVCEECTVNTWGGILVCDVCLVCVISITDSQTLHVPAPRRLLLEGGGDFLPPAATELFCGMCRMYAVEKGLAASVTDLAPAQVTVAVIPWASSRETDELFGFYAPWLGATVKPVLMPSIADVEANAGATALTLLQECSGVFFTGGDQSLIAALLDRLPAVREVMHTRYAEGCPYSGTSAGCAIMSHTMLTGEGGKGPQGLDWTYLEPDKVDTRRGLGLVSHIVLDQHFVLRARHNRLLSVMMSGIEPYALGVDEDVAVALVDGRFMRVYGPPDRVVVQLTRVGTRFDQFVTTLLRASPNGGDTDVWLDLFTLGKI
jgi:cyanophycinase